MNRRRLVVICVDGGVPSIIRRHDFFNLRRGLPSLPGSEVHDLPTIFPSSTAPAHAAFVTGTHADGHGIVGNRFWQHESVAEIRRRADDPLSAFHPYENTSLTAPHLLDRLADQGASIAAVHFPHTFSRTAARPIPSCYSLYAPARCVDIALAPEGTELRTSYHGHEICLALTLDRHTGTLTVGHGGVDLVTLQPERPSRVDVPVANGSISVAVSFSQAGFAMVRLHFGTAVITTGFGGFAPAGGGEGPASLEIEYTANPFHDFHESPRAEWVERTALDMLTSQDPDVLFVRFNQADHAQEFLYWYAVRGIPPQQKPAWQQILDTYTRIDECVARLAEAIGDQAEFVFISDHGIDYVETHLRPNQVIADLGFADRMVFQGDSNCTYLYADAPLSAEETQLVTDGLCALDPSVQVLTPKQQAGLRLPVGSPRVGRMVVTCGEHIEFQYGLGEAREIVESASHGYLPSSPAMNGFYRCFGRVSAKEPVPGDITEAASVVERVWQRLSREA